MVRRESSPWAAVSTHILQLNSKPQTGNQLGSCFVRNWEREREEQSFNGKEAIEIIFAGYIAKWFKCLLFGNSCLRNYKAVPKREAFGYFQWTPYQECSGRIQYKVHSYLDEVSPGLTLSGLCAMDYTWVCANALWCSRKMFNDNSAYNMLEVFAATESHTKTVVISVRG